MKKVHQDKLVRMERMCEERGVRLNVQRRTVLEALAQEDHPEAEGVQAYTRKVGKVVSLASVYRALRALEAAGIVIRHDFGDGRRRYEPAFTSHHDHLIDVDTGQVVEFRNDEIEKLQEKVAEELGYRLVGHRLELFGVVKK